MEQKQINKLTAKLKRFTKFKFQTQIDLFIDLTNAKADLKRQQAIVKSALDEIDFKLVKIFTKKQTQSANQRGRLVFLHCQIWAGRCEGVEIVDAIAGLKKARLGKKYIKELVDSDKLHVLFRDLAEKAEDGKPEIPENLKDYFQANEIFSIRSRKA